MATLVENFFQLTIRPVQDSAMIDYVDFIYSTNSSELNNQPIPLIRNDAVSEWFMPPGHEAVGAVRDIANISYLIAAIDNCQNTGLPDSWESASSHLNVAIYPGLFFPHIVSLSRRAPEHIQTNKAHPSDDMFTILAFISGSTFVGGQTRNFYTDLGEKIVSSNGLTLSLIVERGDLKRFRDELYRESNPCFKSKF